MQYNEQILNNATKANKIDSNHRYLIENGSFTNQLIISLHRELTSFHRNFLSLGLMKYFKNPKLENLFQKRINHIETILDDEKHHRELFKYVHEKILEIDQITSEIKLSSEKEELFLNLNNQFNKYKKDFDQIKEKAYFDMQLLLGTHLELAIRTMDTDLQLIEQTLNGSTLTDIIPDSSLISIKISQPPIQLIESQIFKDLISIRDHLSVIETNMKACQTKAAEEKVLQNLFMIDTVSHHNCHHVLLCSRIF